MRSRQDSGFTLLEICVAIAIFAIGVLTSLSVLVPAVRWGAEAKTDFTAAEAALSAAEYLQAGGPLPPNRFYLGNGTPDFYPFAVLVSDSPPDVVNPTPTAKLEDNKLPGKKSTDFTLFVYRRLLDPEGNGAYQPLDPFQINKVVNDGTNAIPIFKTKVKLYRP